MSITPQQLIGNDPAWLDAKRRVEAAARRNWGVLLTGENGTGKSTLARYYRDCWATYHDAVDRPWVVLDCTTIVGELAEATMFGIGKGVATGVHPREGAFRQADGGVIFLDEVGELPLELQPKLLRVLEEGVVEVVGVGPVGVDVTVIAATNRDLRGMVAEGTFRADLYWRLVRTCQVKVPGLDERPGDIWAFAESIRRNEEPSKCFAPDVRVLLTQQDWSDPVLGGNVRQLEQAVCHAILEADLDGSDMIYASHFGVEIDRLELRREAANEDVDDLDLIVQLARQAGDDGIARRDVAELLDVSPATAKRRLRDLVESGRLRRERQRYYR